MSGPKDFARGLAGPGLIVVRRRFGKQVVNWTPEFMGFGNQLYLWAWAHARRELDPPHRVLIVERTRYWLPFFPAVAPYLVERSDVSLLDQRSDDYAYKQQHSGDPRGFTDRSRESFVRDWVLSSPALSALAESVSSSDVLTLNIRRGDFYSNPWHRPEYAFDIEAYLRIAVPRAIAREGQVRRIHVVSDDLEWCRRHLGWLATHAEEVTHPNPSAEPIDHFRDVCSARRLIIANGTFSLWGAAIAQVVHGKAHSSVWAPAFFQRRYGPGRCVEYDRDWNFVDDLPHGWQPDWVVKGMEDDPRRSRDSLDS